MKVSIHQPDYIPWLGLFYKMAISDLFIHLDDCQYSNEAAHNFNVIKTAQGKLRLKFPVEQHLGDPINKVRPKDELNWKKKHLRTIEMNYAKTPFFHDFFPKFEEVIMHDYATVADLNIAINEMIARTFGITTPTKRASEFNISTTQEQRIIDLCLAANADEYISGNGARVYQTESHFTNNGLKLTYIDYQPITYRQHWKDFLPCMSAIDYIFNCGYDFNAVIKQVAELNGNR